MKILTAHQPAYLPWLGYFHKIALADEFILLDSVQFEKNSFINRNKLKTANGEAWLTIPVEMKGHIDRNVNEMIIDERSEWRKKHWNTFYLNYKKAPYFSRYSDFFEAYYNNKSSSVLGDFVEASTNYLLVELGVKTIITKLSSLTIESKKQELILDLCKETKSNLFVFGSQGKEYADLEKFKSNSIDCYFQSYSHPHYQQLWGQFTPNLSVIDCLCNHGSEKTSEIIFSGNIRKEEL